MSKIDKRALREAAVRAGGVKWQYMRATQHSKAYITDDKGSTVVNCSDGDVPAKCAGFIAAANPATVLALLDELEAAEERVTELSQKADIYDMLRQDYGLQGSLVDFVDWQSKRIAELEAREVVLPSAHDVHPLGPQSAKIFCEFHRSIVNRCADEIRKVGVKVSIKGN